MMRRFQKPPAEPSTFGNVLLLIVLFFAIILIGVFLAITE